MTNKELAVKLMLTEISAPAEEAQVSGCYIGDLLSWVMANAKAGQVWLTIMGNVNVIAVARLTDVAAIVVCENAPIDDDALAHAKNFGIGVYATSKTIYDTALNVGALLS